jgi:TRAP-type C4-dicarboxylate transport system permease small subunit
MSSQVGIIRLVYLGTMSGSESGGPRWIGVPVRALLVTFLCTLLSFAVALLLSIMGTVVYSQIEHVAPNLPFAYRHIAFPFAIAVGGLVLVVMLFVEIRNYRQRKALAGLERQLSH